MDTNHFSESVLHSEQQ